MPRYLYGNTTLLSILDLLAYRGKSFTVREIVQDDNLCSLLGYNPYCMNEGLATGDEVVEIDSIIQREIDFYNIGKSMKWQLIDDAPDLAELVLIYEAMHRSFTSVIGVKQNGEFWTGAALDDRLCTKPILFCKLW